MVRVGERFELFCSQNVEASLNSSHHCSQSQTSHVSRLTRHGLNISQHDSANVERMLRQMLRPFDQGCLVKSSLATPCMQEKSLVPRVTVEDVQQVYSVKSGFHQQQSIIGYSETWVLKPNIITGNFGNHAGTFDLIDFNFKEKRRHFCLFKVSFFSYFI